MANQQQAQTEIAKLIEKFETERNRLTSEANIRANFIDWLFAYLGWDVWRDDPEHKTAYEREAYVRGAGFVDVGLEIRGQPVLFLEAKRFRLIPASTERTGDRTTEEKQAFRYARGKKITYAILTNFQRLHLFNADHERLIFAFDDPQEYLDRFEELWRLSPGEVERGSLPWWEGQLEKKDVDLEFLTALRRWRLLLARAIYEHNRTNRALSKDGTFDFERLMQAVQRILDRLILIRYGDDKEVLLEHDLLEKMLEEYRGRGAYSRPDHLMRAFIDLSQMMDEHHNTTLFAPGHVCEQVTLPNEPLAQVIGEMNNISFRKFTADILGNTYESYLGTKLTLRQGQIVDEERRDIRKGRGIYYTPRWVVEYIVDNTLDRRLKELEEEHGLHAIEKLRGLAVLDPACGSGSFLIYAYQVLAEFYRHLNQAIAEEQARLVTQATQLQMFNTLEQLRHLPQPVLDYPQVILKEHLFEVDSDPEAAEIAAVNLTMQAFADSRQKRLPLILNENIKVGNSLISGTEEELRRYFGDAWQEKHPFNWEQEFPDIMARGGFDVVIGNPPWVALTGPRSKDVAGKDEVPYFKRAFLTGSDAIIDTYALFLERSAALLRQSGLLSFVLPDILLLKNYPACRKFILDNFSISVIRPVGMAFGEVNLDAVCLVLQKETSAVTREQSNVKVSTDSGDWTIAQEDFERQPKHKFNIYMVGDIAALKAKIDAVSLPLGTLWECHEGIHSGNVRSKLFRKAAELPVDKPLVFGREEIGRYKLDWSGRYVRYSPSEIDRASGEYAGLGRLEYFSNEKLVVRRTGDRIVATFDSGGFFVSNNMFILIPRAKPGSTERPSLKFVLGILNSALGTAYFRWIQPRVGKLFAEIKIEHLHLLPIRRIDFNNPAEKAMHDRLVVLVERMLALHCRLSAKGPVHDEERAEIERHIAQADREIDALVYDLYGLSQEEIEMVEQTVKR